jgi:hypothetical protein
MIEGIVDFSMFYYRLGVMILNGKFGKNYGIMDH